jgi:hypothetical protein
MMYQGRILKVLNTSVALIALALLGVGEVASAATALGFSYPNGFASSAGAIHLAGGDTAIVGTAISLTDGATGDHEAGGAWYTTQQDISSFTTDFTFQPNPSGYGITFSIQNSNNTTNPLAYGFSASADSNLLGYGAYNLANASQYAILKSIAVKFDLSDGAQKNYPSGGVPNGTGLYINGGPMGAFIPEIDLTPSGVNFHTGDIMAVHIVYDGSLLTMTLLDTVTNAQFRTSWPIDIPSIVGGNTAWVGFTGGTIPAVSQNLLTWSFSQGFASRLSAPSFNVAPGTYASAQSVSMSAPAGATIYYTTNGQQPTSSSSKYTGPITVSSSEVVQAVATEAGNTDSLVSMANYQIGPANSPIINFPNGFANASGSIAPVGYATLSGPAIQLTDTNSTGLEAAAAWYVAPVNVQSFTTSFQLQLTNAYANGMTFCIQNQPPTSSDTSIFYVSGGPFTVGYSQGGLGYSGAVVGTPGSGVNAGILSSVAVKFDLYDGTGNTTGMYTNGADVSVGGIDMTSSGVSLHSGNPLNVTLAYNGTTLTMTITDTKTKASFSKGWTINIPATVGGNTAYVGFTASTGGMFANQKVLSWTYLAGSGQAPAVPAAPSNLRVQ